MPKTLAGYLVHMMNSNCFSKASVTLTAAALVISSLAIAQSNGQAAQAETAIAPATWSVKLPMEENVIFKGVVSLDGAGNGPGTMMYPAYGGAGGFLAAIITHGVLAASIKSEQKTKLQETADLVLSPYQPVLSTYSHQELANESLKRISPENSKKFTLLATTTAPYPRIESTPVFSMTQDQRAIVLENFISITKAPGATQPAYQNLVKVVSAPETGEKLPDAWIDNNGAKLRQESARLLAHSLEIAIADAENPAKDEETAQKTFRYMEGKTMKIERAQLLKSGCDRTIIKTLRGWVMSIPTPNERSEPASACTTMLANQRN